jgi:hypothetical protein
VISSRTARSRAIRQLATLIVLVFCCLVLPIGCGEPTAQKSTMPPEEFAKKLETEKPNLFVEKVGKNKTAVLGGRDRRAVIRREQQREREQGTQ